MSNSPDDRPTPPPPYGVAPPPPPPAGPAPAAPAPPTYGQPPAAPPPPPAYGQAPAYGQPAYGQPAYGQPPAYGYQTPVATKPPRPAVPIAATLLLIGGALVILGSVLNWFSVAGIDVNGFTSGDDDDINDGPFFTFFAVVLIGFAITFFAAKRVFVLAILSVIFACFVIIPAFSDFSDVQDLKDIFGDAVKVGPGLPIVIVGGFVSLAGGIVALAKRRR